MSTPKENASNNALHDVDKHDVVKHDAIKRVTPYEEVLRWLHMGGQSEIESLDGGSKIVIHTPDGDLPSPVGEFEDDGRMVKEEEDRPFNTLSPEAQSLYRELKSKGKLP